MRFTSATGSRLSLFVLCVLLALWSARAAPADDKATNGSELVEPMEEGTREAEYSTIAEDGTLEEKSGEFKADFGTIEVPENRRDPETRTF
jgi:hypothetical protein